MPAPDLHLRRKWTFRHADHQLVLVKRRGEKAEHVFQKAFLWALYVDRYPGLLVEKSIGDRYKPDLIQLGEDGRPVFWGECGQVKVSKVLSIIRRFSGVRLALARWGESTSHFANQMRKALAPVKTASVVELWNFPADSQARYIDDRGELLSELRQIQPVILKDPQA